MKVLLTSTSFPQHEQDWQGRFIYDMAAALGRMNDVDLCLWSPPGFLPSNVTNVCTSKDSEWLIELARSGGIANILRNKKLLALIQVPELLWMLRKAYFRNVDVDVIHVNWLQNALPLWGTKIPALITVLGSDFGLLKLPGMRALLRSVIKQRKCILAPNASWMQPDLETWFGDVAEVRTIPFGVNQSWFDVARHLEPIPQWLVISRITRNKIGPLFEWGEGLFGEERKLHLFGPMQEEMSLPSWVGYHGPTHPSELLKNWFPRATGLLTLSQHDEGRPQVMLEAMAAGLPIIASALPAHRDFLGHKETGWLTDSSFNLRSGLMFLEEAEQNRKIGEAAKAWVKMQIGTWDDCAGRYWDAYQTLLRPEK